MKPSESQFNEEKDSNKEKSIKSAIDTLKFASQVMGDTFNLKEEKEK